MRFYLVGSALLASLALAGACVQEEPVESQDIVSTIPWPDREQAEYVLLDRQGEEELGRGLLAVVRRDGQFELNLRFLSEEASDESTVLVDATTLKPVSVRREFRGEETLAIEGEYNVEEGIVEITEISNGDERQVPLRLLENYYENESSLFLWRTLPFQEGFEATYNTIMVNQRERLTVTVRVVGRETVEVPAGTFDAWRVQIRSGGISQVAWYAADSRRHLVKYDNSELVFLLEEPPQESEEVRAPDPYSLPHRQPISSSRVSVSRSTRASRYVPSSRQATPKPPATREASTRTPALVKT
jgi:hypothetical protein